MVAGEYATHYYAIRLPAATHLLYQCLLSACSNCPWRTARLILVPSLSDSLHQSPRSDWFKSVPSEIIQPIERIKWNYAAYSNSKLEKTYSLFFQFHKPCLSQLFISDTNLL